MDKKRGIKNVITSVAFKILIFIATLFTRRFLIDLVGNDANGLNSLYLSVIGFLSVAELGVGSAITFCMYKPIVEGDNGKVSALYHLFTKLYLIIGGIIFVAGCILMPFLKYFAADYTQINQNLYLTFFLMLISVVITYFFSSKTSLFNAYKNNYVATTITSSGMILQCVLQILVLYFTHSFVWYLVCRIIAAVVQWIITEIVARKKYGAIIRDGRKIDDCGKREVTKNVKAMFMHKVGAVLINSGDSIIISSFIGVVILGKYSNYSSIVLAMETVINLIFTSLTSVIGFVFAEGRLEEGKKYLNFFHTLNFIVGIVFFMGYYAVIDDVIAICFKSELIMAKSISFIIALNHFIVYMRQAAAVFRDASGTFYYDRWRPVLEGLLNIALSISFVFLFEHFFGGDFAVVGVIVATIITNLAIAHVVEPHVLFKYALHGPAKKYYIKNYIYIAVFIGMLFLLNFCMQSFESRWAEFFVNGLIAVALALVPALIAAFVDSDFKGFAAAGFRKLKAKLRGAKNKSPEDGEK